MTLNNPFWLKTRMTCSKSSFGTNLDEIWTWFLTANTGHDNQNVLYGEVSICENQNKNGTVLN